MSVIIELMKDLNKAKRREIAAFIHTHGREDYKPLKVVDGLNFYQFHVPVYSLLPSQSELKIGNQRLNEIEPTITSMPLK